ncbi:MAG: DUF6240 domain-containing protein [Lachnospiraceae bacterium]|nr:DUF6240 domain-containing protein [Lachnospiraceae bacterium]
MQIDHIKIGDFIKKEDEKVAGLYGGNQVIIPESSSFNASKKEKVDGDGITTTISGPKAKGVGVESSVYDKHTLQNDTVADKLQQDIKADSTAKELHNEMAVYSQTTSEKDFAKMVEDGFNPMEMEAHEIVTVADKIKVALAKGGHDVSKMGGVSEGAIEAMGASSAEVRTIEHAIRDAYETRDLPIDNEVVKDGVQAYNMLSEIPTELSDATKEYLVTNESEPTIENVYHATFSAPKVEDRITPMEESIQSVKSGEIDSKIQAQMENIIEESGLKVSKDTLGEAKWLMDNDIAINEKNILQIDELNAIKVEGNKNQYIDAIADYAAMGSKPQTMDLRDLQSMISLQENKMVMTYEASYQIAKLGIDMDSTSMQEMIDVLKNMENDCLKTMLGEVDEVNVEQKIDRFNTFTQSLDQLAKAPASFITEMAGYEKKNIVDISGELERHISKPEIAERFKEFENRFETVMTAPRADMGDSIKKAFANVDDILSDLGMELNENNRRAVRILAYNNQKIDESSIDTVKTTDASLQRMFKALKPAAVISMIREGHNPLDMKMEDLTELAEDFNQEAGNENQEEKFSKFLWKMEKTEGISQEERDSFIGIYRLIHQVESKDGAAVGALIAQGADVTLRNLMTAVRSKKHTGREYKIDDDFGEISEFKKEDLTITEQIEMAFQYNALRDAGDIMTPAKMQTFENEDAYMQLSPEGFKEALIQAEAQSAEAEQTLEQQYQKELRNQVATALKSEAEVYEMLERYDIPSTPANLTAMQAMLNDRNKMYRDLLKYSKDENNLDEITIGDIIEDLIEEYGEACKTPEDMAKAQRKLEETAENVMKSMLVERDVQEIDIRGMKMVMTQIAEVGKISTPTSESYNIPILVEDKVGNLSLKIVHGTEEKGLVEVAFDTEPTGAVYGSFRYEAGEIVGDMEFKDSRTRQLFADHMGLFAEDMARECGLPVSFKFAYDKDTSIDDFYGEKEYDFELRSNMDEVDADTKGQDEITTRRLYSVARSFIATAGEILS